MLATTALKDYSVNGFRETENKRRGLLSRWRNPTSLGSQRARTSGPSSLVGHLHQDHRASREHPVFRLNRTSQTQSLGTQVHEKNWPCSLADGCVISARKGHVLRRTKLALRRSYKSQGKLHFNKLPEVLPCNTDRNTVVTQSYDYLHQNRIKTPGLDMIECMSYPQSPALGVA